MEQAFVGRLQTCLVIASLPHAADRSGGSLGLFQQRLALSPAVAANQLGQLRSQIADLCQPVEQQTGLGRIVNVGLGHERVAADILGGRRMQAMSFGDDQLVDLLDGFRFHAADVVTDSPPIETAFVPIANLHHGSQVAIIAAEILQVIVCQVGAQADGGQDKDLPQSESFAALMRIRSLQDIGSDVLQRLLTNLWLRKKMLQAA